MKPIVIYHANCTDGFGAAFSAWLKLGDEAEYLPMQYGRLDTPQDVAECFDCSISDREVYILDFSLKRPAMDWLFQHAKRVVWLDHHKTAFEMWCSKAPDLFFTVHKEADDQKHIVLDDCKSGAMLAWEYFHPGTEAPMLIRHIDDRDRWQFKLEGSKELNAALRSHEPWSFDQWRSLFYDKHANLIKEGAGILRAHNQNVQAVLKQAQPCTIVPATIVSLDSYKAPWGWWTDPEHGDTCGVKGLAVNAPSFLASDLGHELANKSGTFGLVWSVASDGQVHCSLRSNGEYDVSAIAKAFGGGGHRNAAGFSTKVGTLLEWLK